MSKPDQQSPPCARRRWRTWAGGGAVITLLFLLLPRILPFPPAHRGVQDGSLAACPSTPNCVCSLDVDAGHAIAPFPLEGSAEETLSRLEQLVSDWPGARVVTRTDDYLHAEFVSRWLGFVDDVEFHVRPDADVVDVRLGLARGLLGSGRESPAHRDAPREIRAEPA